MSHAAAAHALMTAAIGEVDGLGAARTPTGVGELDRVGDELIGGRVLAFGGILGLSPLLALIFPVIGLLLVVPTRIVSLMSVVGTVVGASIIAAWWFFGDVPGVFALYGLIATILIEYKHIPNIRRLIAGTEPRIGQGGDRPATG